MAKTTSEQINHTEKAKYHMTNAQYHMARASHHINKSSVPKVTKATKVQKVTKVPKAKHPTGWEKSSHYMAIGGQCGQSCPCCRATVYKSGMDPDAKFGACTICL